MCILPKRKAPIIYTCLAMLSLLLWVLPAAAQTTIYSESFTASNGTTTSANWVRDISRCSFGSGQSLDVQSNKIAFRNTNCTALWYSNPISISKFANVSISIDLSETGTLEGADNIAVWYQIDGGSPTMFAVNGSKSDDFTSCTATVSGLNGNTVIFAVVGNNNASDEYYYADNALVTGTAKPNFTAALATTHLTCNGSNNGAVNLTVSPGAAAGTVTSPYGCGSCNQSISGSGAYSISAGQTYCVAVGQTYTGALTLNGGTLVVCGTANPSSITFNSGSIVNNGSMSLSSLTVGQARFFINYGTLSVSGTASSSGYFYNFGTATYGAVTVSTPGFYLNTGTATVNGNITNGESINNSGTITVNGILNNNSGGSFDNEYRLNATTINNTGTIDNDGQITVTGTTTISSGSTFKMPPGSKLITQGLVLSGTMSNTSSTACASVNISGTTTLNGSGAISGKISICDANGIETNNSPTLSNGAGINCTCTAISNYSFAWSNGATTQNLSGKAPGIYTVTVTGPNGTTATQSSTITQPAVLSATAASTNQTKNNLYDGTIDITVSGGTSPYTYGWSNSATTQDLANLQAGTYTVTITDSRGCTATKSATVTLPTASCMCIVNGNWSSATTWTGNCSGGGGTYAGATDNIVLQGNKVTVDGNYTVKSILMKDSSTDTTRLSFNGNTLTVSDSLRIQTTGIGKNIEIAMNGTAKMNIGGNLNIIHSLGSKVLIDLNSTSGTAAKLYVGGNFYNEITGTATDDITITASTANDTIQVVGNLILKNSNSSSGVDLQLAMGSNGKLIVNGNITFAPIRDQNTEIALNGTSQLQLKGNIIRPELNKFGKIGMASTSTFVLAGQGQQTLAGNKGAGADSIQYSNLTINNSYAVSPQVVTAGNVFVTNTLTLADGYVATNSDTITLANSNASSLSGFSANSYITGYFRRYIASNTQTYDFPLGYGGTDQYHWAKVKNNLLTGVNTLTAYFHPVTQSDLVPIVVSGGDIIYNAICPTGIWSIEPNNQPAGGNYEIQLSTENMEDLFDNMFGVVKRPAGSSAQSWTTGGGIMSSWASADRMLYIGYTSLRALNSFSDFGIGMDPSASLPVELLTFSAEPDKKTISLKWSTQVEVNNDFFTVLRSLDGENFEEVAVVKGSGNSTITQSYSATDNDPYLGFSYYRLKQTDFDGKSTFTDMVSVSLTNYVATDFSIYPNPNTGTFNVDITSTETKLHLMVLNQLGQLLYADDITNATGNSRVTLDLTDVLPAGLYFVKISAGENTMIKQLMIE